MLEGEEVTPLSYSSTYADAFSTVLFVLGKEAAISFATTNDLSILMAFETVEETYEYYASENLNFELLLEEYTPIIID